MVFFAVVAVLVELKVKPAQNAAAVVILGGLFHAKRQHHRKVAVTAPSSTGQTDGDEP
jgi:hypothetical protein